MILPINGCEPRIASTAFPGDTGAEADRQRLRSSIEEALKRAFRPELLNRIDEVIIFDPLSKEQVKQIVDLMIREVGQRLKDLQVTLALEDSAKEWLVEQGYDAEFGARALRRTIQRSIENPLAKRILAGEFPEGSHVVVGLEEDTITFVSHKGTSTSDEGTSASREGMPIAS